MEGVVTDTSRNIESNPYLYIPQLMALLGVITGLVYYHHMECWNRPHLKKAREQNRDVSLWWTYFRVYGLQMTYSVVLRLGTTIFTILPSLAVSGVVTYASQYYYDSVVQYALVDKLEPIREFLVKTNRKVLEIETSLNQIYERVEEIEKAYSNGKVKKYLAIQRAHRVQSLPLCSGKARSIRVAFVDTTPFATVQEIFANGFVLVILMAMCFIVSCIIIVTSYRVGLTVSVKVKTAIQMLIYEKSLQLRSSSYDETSAGMIINNSSVDAIAVQWFLQTIAISISVPFSVITTAVLIIWKVGMAGVIGLCAFVVCIPILSTIMKIQRSVQRKNLGFADARLKKCNELFHGIKLIKMCGWEELFSSHITEIRNQEIAQVRRIGLLYTVSAFVSQILPIVVPFIIFAVYSAISSTPLTPDIAFTTLALSNLTVGMLLRTATMIGMFVEALASNKRIERFISPDTDGSSIESDDIDVTCKNLGQFLDQDEDAKRLLQNGETMNYQAIQMSNTSKIGVVESAAQTIGPDIAIEIISGEFSWNKSQLPVLTNIHIQIPSGVLTIVIGKVGSGKTTLISALIGEVLTISGEVNINCKKNNISYVAQKAWLQNATVRENIIFGEKFDHARYQTVLDVCALNQDLDIFPGGDLTEIGEKGINLSGGQKQRISLARAVYSRTDIVVMDDPLSALDAHVGAHVMEKAILDFLLVEKRTVILVTHHVQYAEYAKKVVVMESGNILHQGNLVDIRRNDPELYSQWKRLLTSVSESESESTDERVDEPKKKSRSDKNQLTMANSKEIEEQASKRLFQKMLHRIIYAPMRFFETTPVGRILNRFAHDTMAVDLRIWMTFNVTLSALLTLLTLAVVNSIANLYFLIVITVGIIFFYMMGKYTLTAPRELRRLDNITKSPVLAQLSETLGGLTTIRAYRAQNRFRQRMEELLEQNNLSQLYLFVAFQLVLIILTMFGVILILLSGIGTLIMSVYGGIEPSLVGVAVTTSLMVCIVLSFMFMQVIEIITYMNGVERVIEYTQLTIEEYKGDIDPPVDWPNKGSIRINNLSARYAEHLDPVLHNINIHFKPGHKVGICGRTGSGKSSLTLALLRIIDIIEGSIFVDGIDITKVPLLTLRNRISIIPQDPVLFSGTIRFNMDPEARYSNEEIWHALEIAQLNDDVKQMNGQLDADVKEGGDNFSAGQRQLFCLARAFLRKTKILIMDEATASIDLQTDARLQEVVAVAFSDKTVITIAHRISTILDSDLVLVLSNGRVMEYDTPQNLLKKDGSMFSSLVNGSN
ncbi:ATP-binding cassette sub-family C member 9-like [Saccoglossus kowalevskii]